MSVQSILPYLPAVNACLILSSGIFIWSGVRAIRRKEREVHQRRMLTATLLATIFLVIYIFRVSMNGMTTFTGPHWVKIVYLLVLFTHLVVALTSTPLVLLTLYRAFRKRFVEHRKIARWTYPMWLYVAATGVLVFVLLHLPYGAG